MTATPSSPRRLVFISHSREVGGAEVYLENLLGYLAEPSSGWESQLIIRRDAILDSWAAEMSKVCPVLRLDVLRPGDVWRLVSQIRRSDLVHLNLSFPAGKYQFGAAFMTWVLGRPLVVTHHLALRVAAPWRWAMRRLGRAARLHIAVSHRSRKVLILDYAYPPERVVVVHNGINPERFRPSSQAARSAMRKQGGETLDGQPWSDEILLACTVARLSPQKGLFDLLEATALVVKEVPSVRVVVIGNGELHRKLIEQARKRGLEHFFFLAGAMSRPRVADWLGAADLFILPSHYEGGPATALMEAMACGCAVVTTEVSGVGEIITDPTLGIVVPPRDPNALATATVELLKDPGRRAALAERARLKVMTEFTIAASLRRTMEVFEAAIEKRSGSAQERR